MQNPETNARDALHNTGWFYNFSAVMGEYWKHPKEEYILKGNALKAFTVLCEVNGLPYNFGE